MPRTQYILLVGLFALILVGQADAANLGLGARYSYVKNIDTEADTDMLGAMLRLRGTFVGLEGAVDYRKDDLGGGFEMKTWPITASLLVYPVDVVYGLAGLGWYNSTLDPPAGFVLEDDTQTELGYHVGAGLEVPVAPTVKITGDVRWLFVDYEFEDIPESIGKVDADSYTLNAGLLIYLK